VLIYFSETAIQQTIDTFAKVLRPGGLLFLGHSESIIGLTKSLQAERLGQCIAYRRKSE
jgi:chemotaxis protein methyltransferase CheR